MPQIVVIESPVDRVIVTSSEQGPKGIQGVKGDQGDPGTSEDDVPYSKRIDAAPSGSNEIYYKGEAVPGSLESAAVWRIRKIVIENDDDMTETWANGTAAFDKIWNDRLSYTYP